MTSKIPGLLFRFFCFCIFLLPLVVQKWIGTSIGILWFDILRIRRQTALENIARVFPQMSRRDAVRMARQSMIHMGYTIMEICSFPFLSDKTIQNMFVYENDGKEKLHKALEKNKGVFLLSAHIGNGDMALVSLAHNGFPIEIISKIFKTKWLNDFWFDVRKKHGIAFIEPRKSTYDILKALKANHMVVFVLDQYTGPPNGIPTKFFGIDTGTAVGPALFTQRSHAVVIPCYEYREKFGKHRIVIEDPVDFEEKETKEETLRHNTERYSRTIEKMILAHPEQWMWIHRRWKKGWD